MDIEYDPAKYNANLAKHGLSLSRFVDLEIHSSEVDPRFTAAFTLRGEVVRVLSLRRAHIREYRRHVQ